MPLPRPAEFHAQKTRRSVRSHQRRMVIGATGAAGAKNKLDNNTLKYYIL